MSGSVFKISLLLTIVTSGFFSYKSRAYAVDTSLLDPKTWEMFDEENGVKLYRRSTEGSKFKEFRGVGVVDAPIPKIITMMADPKNMPAWVSDCIQGELLGRNFDPNDLTKEASEYQEILYGVNRLPWPLQNRDYVIKSNVEFVRGNKEQAPRALIRNFSTTHPSKPDQSGLVRMPQMSVFLVLSPVGGTDIKRTIFDFTVSVDPGGVVPAWAVNLASRVLPMKTIMGLRELVRKPSTDKQVERLVEFQFNKILKEMGVVAH